MRDYTQPMSFGDSEALPEIQDDTAFSSVLTIHPNGVSIAPVYPGVDEFGNEDGIATVGRNHKAGRLFRAGRP